MPQFTIYNIYCILFGKNVNIIKLFYRIHPPRGQLPLSGTVPNVFHLCRCQGPLGTVTPNYFYNVIKNAVLTSRIAFFQTPFCIYLLIASYECNFFIANKPSDHILIISNSFLHPKKYKLYFCILPNQLISLFSKPCTTGCCYIVHLLTYFADIHSTKHIQGICYNLPELH
jgi:hypothetical protein